MRGGFVGDKRGIEGLPMRLIIIVVVAAVVLAAILAMIPKTKGTLSAECISVDGKNGNLKDVTSSTEDEVNVGNFEVKIKVTDDKGNPVKGASVTLTGAHGAGSGKTGGDGVATITVLGAKLDANEDTDSMKVTVTAPGYHKYEENNFVIIARTG